MCIGFNGLTNEPKTDLNLEMFHVLVFKHIVLGIDFTLNSSKCKATASKSILRAEYLHLAIHKLCDRGQRAESSCQGCRDLSLKSHLRRMHKCV